MPETQHGSYYSSDDDTQEEDDVTLSHREVAVLNISRSGSTEKHSLKIGKSLVGREPTTTDRAKVDIVINDPTISRSHAAIELNADGMAFVQDLESSNKTRLIIPILHPHQLTDTTPGKTKINSETILQPNRLYQVKHLDKIIFGKISCEFALTQVNQTTPQRRAVIIDTDTQGFDYHAPDRDEMETQPHHSFGDEDSDDEPKEKQKQKINVLETPARGRVSFGNEDVVIPNTLEYGGDDNDSMEYDFDIDSKVTAETPMLDRTGANNTSILSPITSSGSSKPDEDDQETQAVEPRALDFENSPSTPDLDIEEPPKVGVNNISTDSSGELNLSLDSTEKKVVEEEQNKQREERVNEIFERQKREEEARTVEKRQREEESRKQRLEEEISQNRSQAPPSPPLNISDLSTGENEDRVADKEDEEPTVDSQPIVEEKQEDPQQEDKMQVDQEQSSQDTDIEETDFDDMKAAHENTPPLQEELRAPSPPLNTSEINEETRVPSPPPPQMLIPQKAVTGGDSSQEIESPGAPFTVSPAIHEEETPTPNENDRSLVFEEVVEGVDDDVVAETLNVDHTQAEEAPSISTPQTPVEEPPLKKRKIDEETSQPVAQPSVVEETLEENSEAISEIIEEEEQTSQTKSKGRKTRVSRKKPAAAPKVSPPKSNKRRNSEANSQTSPKNKSKYAKPSILFTGKPVTPQQRKQIEKLGGTVLEDQNVKELMIRNKVTHLVTDKIRRTFKFLCALSKCPFIVDASWITASNKAKHFINEEQYILADKETEEKLDFSLKESLRRREELADQGVQLFANMSFFITESVKPPELEMQAIIECSGGSIVRSISSLRSEVGRCNNADTQSPKLLILTCPEDIDECTDKILPVFLNANKDEEEVKKLYFYSAEFVLSSVMKFEVDISDHKFDFDQAPSPPPSRGSGKKAAAPKKRGRK